MKVMCIDADFRDFSRKYGYRYNFPKEGHTYKVRGDNGNGYLLEGISNPFFLISLMPLIFEELHFAKKRFVICEDAPEQVKYLFYQN